MSRETRDVATEQHGPPKDHVSPSLMALQLPAHTLQYLWRGAGHLVPGELDRLISFLHETRDVHRASFAGLKKQYEDYVAICKSFEVTFDDPLSSKNDWKALGELDTALSSEAETPFDIPLKFARIEKLRAAEQVLADIDLITRVLVKVRDRFSGAEKHKTGDIRLFISVRGTSMAMQLVYEPKTTSGSRRGKPSEPANGEPSEYGEVLKWLEMGRRALERGAASFPINLGPQTEAKLTSEAGSRSDSLLDGILPISAKGKLETHQ